MCSNPTSCMRWLSCLAWVALREHQLASVIGGNRVILRSGTGALKAGEKFQNE